MPTFQGGSRIGDVNGTPRDERPWANSVRRLAKLLFRSHRATRMEVTRLSAEIDRLSAELELVWRALRRDGDTLHDPADAAAYRSFMERYRGSTATIRHSVGSYVDRLRPHSPVLDLGCGRGELLDLLQEQGIDARGVERDERLAAECRARGLTVVPGDAVAYVQNLPPESVGSVVMLQLLEHLSLDEIGALFPALYQAIRPGGHLVAETINVTSWTGFSSAFLRDYTHRTPLHPDTLAHLIAAAGFDDVTVEYRSLCDPDVVLQHFTTSAADPALQAAFNRNVDLVNSRMFGYQDYAVLARRP